MGRLVRPRPDKPAGRAYPYVQEAPADALMREFGENERMLAMLKEQRREMQALSEASGRPDAAAYFQPQQQQQQQQHSAATRSTAYFESTRSQSQYQEEQRPAPGGLAISKIISNSTIILG